MKRPGFTLIELLVVLGIMALLAALLFPVFSRVREKGRQTTCLSNERQLGVAFHLYAQDNDDYTALGALTWAGSFYPYVKNVSVFHCPSDPTDDQPPYYPMSYGSNANLWHSIIDARGQHRDIPHSNAEISPKTVLLFEVSHDAAQVMTPDEGWTYTGVPLAVSADGDGLALTLPGAIGVNLNVRYATGLLSGCNGLDACDTYYEGPGRHSGGSNFLFADAHAQWLAPQKVSSGGDAYAPGDAPHYSNGAGTAAGSEDSGYAATFSTK